MAFGTSSSASTWRQRPAPRTCIVRDFDEQYYAEMEHFPPLATYPREHIMKTIAMHFGYYRFDVLVSYHKITSINDAIIVLKHATVPTLRLPNASFNLESILKFPAEVLPTVSLEFASVHFPDDQIRQASPEALARLKQLRGLRFLRPIDIDILRQILADEMRNITNLYLCGRQLVADDFKFLSEKLPCLAQFSCSTDGYFPLDTFDLAVKELKLEMKIHGNSLTEIPENNHVKKLELLDCAEVPHFNFFKKYKRVEFLALIRALSLSCENIETAGFANKLTNLTLFKTPAVCDQLLISLHNAQVCLAHLIVPLDVTVKEAQGFTSQTLKRYLEARCSAKLKEINVYGHSLLDKNVFSANYSSSWNLELFDLRWTGIDDTSEAIRLSAGRDMLGRGIDLFGESSEKIFPSVLRVLYTHRRARFGDNPGLNTHLPVCVVMIEFY
jgi:hypothetical protein